MQYRRSRFRGCVPFHLARFPRASQHGLEQGFLAISIFGTTLKLLCDQITGIVARFSIACHKIKPKKNPLTNHASRNNARGFEKKNANSATLAEINKLQRYRFII